MEECKTHRLKVRRLLPPQLSSLTPLWYVTRPPAKLSSSGVEYASVTPCARVRIRARACVHVCVSGVDVVVAVAVAAL